MNFLPQAFSKYIAPNTDRCAFIQDWLLEHGVKSNCLVMDEKKHILVQFAKSAYDPRFKIKTVVAHYDRVEHSPGANDNSAADWMLMEWAVELSNKAGIHNVRIIFTDGEELGWNTGVSEQGAYSLATVFRRLGITNDDVYVFDACGRGEVPVLSRTQLGEKTPQDFLSHFNDLYNRSQALLAKASPGRWMTLPVPYSDNASFLACGIPAVAITMLPADEASLYAREILRDKNLENAVLNREKERPLRKSGEHVEYGYKERMPKTWRLFHTMEDNEASLTPQSFSIMGNILSVLAETLVPA